MSSSNQNYNARRGFAAGDSYQQPQHQYSSQQQQGNLHSGLRRSHLYGSRGTTFNFTNDSDNPTSKPVATYSRLDAARPGHTNLTRPKPNNQSHNALPTAGEYFSKEPTASLGGGVQSGSPSAPWTRPANRFSRLPANSYGLPPTPESDVSVSRITTPPRHHRDHQFNVEMMQRMTQHAKISPLNQYSSLKKQLAEDNLVVENGNVDRLVARAGERVSGTNATTTTSRGYEGATSEPMGARRVAFRSSEAVEGAREASRRLNGASTIDRPNSMYEAATKPTEPNSTSNMYAELKRTLSESSSERPKRAIRPPSNQRQLRPLSPVQRRHVEVRPRRPTGGLLNNSHTPSPQQNDYYPQETRPVTTKEEPANTVDWLAAANDIAEESSQKPSVRRRNRTLSSGTPIGSAARATRRSEEFGGELRPDSTDIRASLPTSHTLDSAKPVQMTSRLSPPAKQQLGLSNTYMKHELVDFVSEDDLTVNLSQEKGATGAGFGGPRSRMDTAANKRPGTSSGNKSQDISFLQSTKQTDPDETLDTLRQLSRLLSGNTPAKQEGRTIIELAASKAVEVKRAASGSNTPESRTPYKHQIRPVARKLIPSGDEENKPNFEFKPLTPGQPGASTVARIPSSISKSQSGLRSVSSTKPRLSTATPRAKKLRTKQPTESKTPTSKTIQFEDGYETDDSLDRLLTHDTDYASLLKPATYEDESFLQGTVQVASQSSKPTDLEALALRTRVLNNLQTVQLDIRETRKGLESIERKFGILEDESMFVNTSQVSKPTPAEPITTATPRQVVILPRRKQRAAGKGLFRLPWTFKDYFCAFLFIVLGLVAIEYKLWSDTIIPQYSKVSSDEWFANHPVGEYKPGATLRAMHQMLVWLGNLALLGLEHVLTLLMWVLSGIQWLEVRVMDAVSPPPELNFVETVVPTVLSAPAETVTTELIMEIVETATTQFMDVFEAATTQAQVLMETVETILPL